jgi:peptide/nickel transport system substrate-binding protein
MASNDNPLSVSGDAFISRRRLLSRGVPLVGLVLAAPSLLAACAGDDSEGDNKSENNTDPSSAGGGTPVRGGTFTVGMVGTGAAETVNPMVAVSIADLARVYALFDRFFDVGPDIKTLVPGLATSAESNDDATLWTLTLREGVTWHDGTPFTADDAVYSLQMLASPDNYGSGLVAGLVDVDNIKATGDLTVEVPLLQGNAQFPALLTSYNASVIKQGATADKLASAPVGTGPFVFSSFSPGSQSEFTANENYWEEGKPYVDKLVINSSFTDVVAQVNALRSGQINVLPQLPFTQVAALKSVSAVKILQSQGVASQYFKMRVDDGPLVDPQVREALQLLTDRQALVDGALSGFGTVANDLLAPDTEYFASDLTRERDVEKAKSLLAAAGKADLEITIATSNAFPGSLESATLFAQQAKDAGVTVKVDNMNPTALATAYLPAPFANAYTLPLPSLDAMYRGIMSSNAVYPETGWGTPERDAAVAEASRTTDPAKAEQLWHDIQTEWFNGGPYIVWGYADNLDAVGSNVRGLQVTPAGNLNNYRFQDGWLVS